MLSNVEVAPPAGVRPTIVLTITGTATITDCQLLGMMGRLGLQFTQMVLEEVEEGPQRVEELDGIDALEQLQYNGPWDVSMLAGGLVDRFYGEDYGL